MNQLRAGAMLSYLSIIVTIVIALLYTPVMIRSLGQSEYGLYSLIGSAISYFSILDMGLGNAIVRYTARNRALGHIDEEAKLNGMFLVLYTFIGILTVIIGSMFYRYVDNIFGVSLTTIELEKARLMVALLIFNFAVSFPLGVFSSFMEGYEKFIVVKIVSIVRSLLIPCVTLPFLLTGYGSVTLVVVSTVVNISCLLFNVYYCFRNLNIKFFFGRFDYKLLREITGYSFFIFLNAIVGKIYWSSDQIILGIVSGTVPVAVYAVAMQFITLYMMFSTSISDLFFPRLSMMVANNASNHEFTSLMVKVGRIQYVIIAYIFGGFILFGQRFINLWAGFNYSEAYYIILILMISLIIPLIQNVGIFILQAKNLHAFRSIIYIIIAILNIIITFPMAEKFGGIGSAIVTAGSLIIGNIIIMNIYYHRRIGIDMIHFWKSIILLTIPISLSIIISNFIYFLISQDSTLYSLLILVLYSIVYVSLMWIFGFNKYEKHQFILISMRYLKKR